MASPRTALLLVAAAAVTFGTYIAIFVIDTTSDRPDTLDVQPVAGAASAACSRLRTELDALPPLPAGASTADREARLDVEDAAVRTLITSVRAVGEPALAKDVPSEQWLRDWATVADARKAYAASGATGPYAPPMSDGRLLTDRMSQVGLDACVVPQALTTAP